MGKKSKIQTQLFELQDLTYRTFQSKLMPTVELEKIIGVRTPALRQLAKKLYGTDDAAEFLEKLPHQYFDENQLHAFLISLITDFDSAITATENFLPYIDNWATCDQLHPKKAFSKNLGALLKHIKTWIKSKETYTIRFGVEMLMAHFLDENFSPEYLRLVAGIKSTEYYVNMMCAWYFATALAKQYDSTISYIEQKKLTPDVHTKTIRKAIESYRITDEQKKYLRTLTLTTASTKK